MVSVSPEGKRAIYGWTLSKKMLALVCVLFMMTAVQTQAANSDPTDGKS